METTAASILEYMDARDRRTIVVTWKGTPPDLSKERWEMCLTNEEPEHWEKLKKGLTSYHTFEVTGIEHGRRIFSDLCNHFQQPEAIRQFDASDVSTNRRLYFLIVRTLGK